MTSQSIDTAAFAREKSLEDARCFLRHEQQYRITSANRRRSLQVARLCGNSFKERAKGYCCFTIFQNAFLPNEAPQDDESDVSCGNGADYGRGGRSSSPCDDLPILHLTNCPPEPIHCNWCTMWNTSCTMQCDNRAVSEIHKSSIHTHDRNVPIRFHSKKPVFHSRTRRRGFYHNNDDGARGVSQATAAQYH